MMTRGEVSGASLTRLNDVWWTTNFVCHVAAQKFRE